MIDAERLEPAAGWCGVRFRSACGENGGGDAKRLTEFAAAEPAAFEVSDETVDEFFHDAAILPG
jgi:hypothetical protein